jgi:hypothetical protein
MFQVTPVTTLARGDARRVTLVPKTRAFVDLLQTWSQRGA